MFHILPDGTDRSAVWVAQRLPDEHIAVCANEFVIGEIDLTDTYNFMASPNVISVAVKHKFYDPAAGKPFNFRKAYSQPEFHVHHSYSDRRNWRVFDLVAPSRKFPSDSTLDTLPFSVKPDMPVSHLDLFRIQRDHYEGTEFDLTKGLAAGPHGNPNRYDGSWASGVPIEFLVEGNFERAISIHRTNYAIVTQSRQWLPNEVGATVWFGAAQPHATCFVPFYPGVNHIARNYQEGSLWKFRRESAWWAFASVGNWMEKNFKYMSEDVQTEQRQHERRISDERNGVETEVSQLLRAGRALEARAKLTDWATDVAERTASAWWDLFEHLITKYLDGARIDDWHQKTFSPTGLFYPFEWLKAVGYWPADMDFSVQGPKPVHVVRATQADRDQAAAQPAATTPAAPATTVAVAASEVPSPAAAAMATGESSSSVWSVLGAAAVFVAGLYCGRLWQKRSEGAYASLPTSE
jgi:dipeptidase